MDNKSQQINSLIKRLNEDLGKSNFVITDHWDADLMAIGISHPRVHGILVYVSVSEEKENYSAILELPSSTNMYNNVGNFNRLNYSGLLEIIRKHLGLSEHAS